MRAKSDKSYKSDDDSRKKGWLDTLQEVKRRTELLKLD